MFEFLEDFEINYVALGLSAIVTFVLYLAWVENVFGMDFGNISLVSRIMAILVAFIGGYFFADRLINKD